MSESSNYWYNSSPILGTSNSIEWKGAEISCQDEEGNIVLHICRGERLTTTQTSIANAICQLIALTDGAEIVIPTCLSTSWAANGTDKTLLNVLNFVLNQLCLQLAQIQSNTDAITTIDPFVTIDLSCCSTNPCVTKGTIKLSEALQSLANCICEQSTRIDTLQEQVNDLSDAFNSYKLTNNGALDLIRSKTDCLPLCS